MSLKESLEADDIRMKTDITSPISGNAVIHNYFDYRVKIIGSCIVRLYENHMELGIEDWNLHKEQIIAIFEQGDKKHGSRENETDTSIKARI